MDTVISRAGSKKKRRNELTNFLRSRRAALSPADVGMGSAGGRTRVGLRREEVAVLAGVSASWYAWLEQGRPINVSDGILDAISRALRLTERERVHLYRLADANPPLPTPRADPPEAEVLQRVVDTRTSGPACVIDRYWDVLAANEQAVRVLRLGQDGNENFLVGLFTGSHGRQYVDLPQVARRMIARFRLQTSYLADDPRHEQMADRLSADSAWFAELWGRHEVEEFVPTTVELDHPDKGPVPFALYTMDLDEASSLRLLMYLPLGVTGPQPVRQ
ncbi:helix-turn-helix transcriptional regulator [Streptomyces somaliensis DSM 40738]|uniref:Helix-turn-helix domain-containing protein n=1 Tax=Streptomyces somaliensis (strain ATCC 33201 / DSM 40738 / JCM 12659 / KCTC 9044 / NCTC 11332 / NRRL B-12077 / IP 733) TaxID=1134445 RepID=A0AA44ICG5_STRE0|nr:helix-turn-helix transcriptional regulator [Streptomyces somaliensis]MCQ0025180.1 helix-turn-helix transcriptional regulator [Streptomyces somaliensis DSM 40738]NKY13387.1 helix-turn-helix domain-containing protein [Streptomyces somaliensis DSM 40738]